LVITVDPRPEAIDQRLSQVKRLLCVVSGKGGVGKSMISSVSALLLSKAGHKVGLLDLDLHGPSTHTILGVKNLRLKEEKGVVPPAVNGVKLMSIVPYIGQKPSLLRGTEISDAVTELLAITRWGRLDFLIVDMPPGTGDEVLDMAGLVEKSEFLVVSTQSKVALETVGRMVTALRELKAKVTGIVENMRVSKASTVEKFAKNTKVPFLNSIGFDKNLEQAIGNPTKLLKTRFAHDLQSVLDRLSDRG
jgi:ATP-binding protein involved in chromosome partitioning